MSIAVKTQEKSCNRALSMKTLAKTKTQLTKHLLTWKIHGGSCYCFRVLQLATMKTFLKHKKNTKQKRSDREKVLQTTRTTKKQPDVQTI